MDGERLRDYWSHEVSALLAAHRQFEILLPNARTRGAAHRGEDGRYVEDLVRTYLRKYLPKDLEVLTGFILRPAVKTDLSNRSRSGDEDRHSTQLDIIVYDTGTFPVFQRFGDSVIVPPEGVVAIISVKKTLRDADISTECAALRDASEICRSDKKGNERVRGPFLALVATSCEIEKTSIPTEKWIFEKTEDCYASLSKFDDLIGLISDLSQWAIFKKRPRKNKNDSANYLYFKFNSDEQHFGFQMLMSGIMSVYYDSTRRNVKRPGFTAFPRRSPDEKLGQIPFSELR
ncbi:hypothetical protein GCM10017083_04780 [Thalassobaculum fulvum]|uniref:DUF6602 domain-containing protein n=1 Tax=Thalassobaculum fulvum TaxID=1633335 RepID=A0A918XP12_9PROT|nr:DUF6602 domain-containing protein [Thalassobaculum fulvum]GHD40978.1 hypothetical protein GCM10017083_04780 [Thalassobaculum fulvum]